MGDCCNSKNSSKELKTPCTGCGKICKPVKRMTLEHLLKEDNIHLIQDVQYFFCQSSFCNVVYFSKNKNVFYKKDLNVRVGLKETEEPILVCYCFGYTKKMIKDDHFKNGRSTIMGKITKMIKEDKCSCEETNPQGSCCLGNVKEVVINNVYKQ